MEVIIIVLESFTKYGFPCKTLIDLPLSTHNMRNNLQYDAKATSE